MNKKETIILGDRKVYYESHHEGPALVLLNGIMMSSKSWYPFLEHLKDYRVILLDFYDQGLSDDGPAVYDHGLQVDLVDAVLNHLGIDQAYIAGVSYGAQVGLQYAIKYPNKVKRLAVMNAGAHTTAWLKDVGIAWQLAARTFNPNLFYHVTIPYIYSTGFYNEHLEWMKARQDLLMDVFTPKFLSRMDRLIATSENYDVRRDLSMIPCPTMVGVSDQDMITPMAEGLRIADGIKEAIVVTFKECGHASMYEQSEHYLTYIRGFFRDGKPLKIV